MHVSFSATISESLAFLRGGGEIEGMSQYPLKGLLMLDRLEGLKFDIFQ